MRALEVVASATLFFCPIVAGLGVYEHGDSMMNKGLNMRGGEVASDTNGDPFRWFNQKLDQSDPEIPVTFRQRYQVNQTWAKPGGPAFLMLGGEGPIAAKWLQTDTMLMLYAQHHGASVFQIEHRFYGETQPFEDLDTPNLHYLTSQQALADAARFIMWATNGDAPFGLNPDTKWIVFGGSYSGALAAWMRLKYPHLVTGAVASSAPVNAVLDFKEYMEVVQDALLTTKNGTECVAEVRNAFAKVEELLKTVDGRKALEKVFMLCEELSTEVDEQLILDSAQLMQLLATAFQTIVQYNNDNRDPEAGKLVNVDQLCDYMTNASGPPILEKLRYVNQHTRESKHEKCLDVSYRTSVDELRSISLPDKYMRAWTWQTCNEFGYFQTTDSDDSKQPFGHLFPIKLFTKLCRDVFGVTNVSDKIFRTLTYYGGLRIAQVSSNIVFPNGSLDPWHVLSVLKTDNPKIATILINGTAHCADMYTPEPRDRIELRRARTEIDVLIGQWLLNAV